MFPPERSAHAAPVPRDPACEERGNRGGAGAFDRQLAALADEQDRARDLSVRDGDDARRADRPSRLWVSSPGCLTAMPSAIVFPVGAWPANGAHAAAWTPTMRGARAAARRARARRPAASPPPPIGHDDRLDLGASCSASSSPSVPWPARTSGSSKAWTKVSPASTPLLRRGDGVVEAVAREHDLGAVALRRLDLRGGRVLGHEDGRAHAGLARRPGDGLAVVAGARRDDAGRALGIRRGARCGCSAPRILKEPVRWRFSAFSQTGRPARRAERLRGDDRRRARDALEPLPRLVDLSECRACRRRHSRPSL